MPANRSSAAKAKADEKLIANSSLAREDVGLWSVSKSGYCWESINGERAIGSHYSIDYQTGFKSHTYYHPMLDGKGIFNIFCNTERTEDGFQCFANDFGLLGIWDASVRVKATGSKLPWHGEKWSYWEQSHREARNVFKIYEHLIGGGDIGQVARVANEEELKVLPELPHEGNWYYFNEESVMHNNDRFYDFRCNNSFDAIIEYFKFHIRTKLKNGMSLELTSKPYLAVKNFQSASFFEMSVHPIRLYDYIWHDFARQLCGNVSYRKCKMCNNELAIGGKHFNSNREFCSTNCRQKDHRLKVKEAKSMKDQGQTVKAIAKKFDTSPETIQKWLTKVK